MRRWLLSLLLGVLAGCGTTEYSDDPEIALAQKHAAACQQIDQSIVTAIALGKAGQLTEDEASVIDRIVAIYEPVCTGEPKPIEETLQDAGAKVAVAELCPELVAVDPSDALITISQAAQCAARKALILQLQQSGGDPA